MTISMTDYFRTRKADRKKETRYINVINKDSCTSCNSCATVCPVDCIYEVVSPVPGQSYHQIDTSRCIGCQMCYMVPTDSTEHYKLEICPWNAIDMLHNPNVKPDDASVLAPYWKGTESLDDVPFPKLEEYGYQFFLDGEVFLPTEVQELNDIMEFYTRDSWLIAADGETCQIVQEVEGGEKYRRYRATEDGRALLDVIFSQYRRIYMD